MPARIVTAAAARRDPIPPAKPRSEAVEHMARLLERAHKREVEPVVCPELALTTFFPRHYHRDIGEADRGVADRAGAVDPPVWRR